MNKGDQSNAEMLKGTLDMMVLRTLVAGDAHGYTIAKVIERTSEDVLEVEQGSLYPALLLGHKREQPQGEVLPADGSRKKAACPRDKPLAADGACHCIGDWREACG